MRVCYTPRYYADIGEGHVFPIRKFELVRDRLVAEGTLTPAEIYEPREAPVADVLLVHTEDYVTRLRAGALTAREVRRLGLPWSKALVRRSFLATAGTTAAARFALLEGVGANLAGGTHHAFPDRGEGFCVLNDVAVAVRVLQCEGLARRAAVVDLDVHQGNGTAHIFEGDPSVFTFSMHGAKNYPALQAPLVARRRAARRHRRRRVPGDARAPPAARLRARARPRLLPRRRRPLRRRQAGTPLAQHRGSARA